jgi:hypothetical protein
LSDSPLNVADLGEALERAELEREVLLRYSETDSYQGTLANKYRRLHHYFAPRDGDQWPEDLRARPGMIHITHNVIAPVVMTEARIESLLPRLALLADSADEGERLRAEAAEKLIIRWLELSGWDSWLNDLCQAKGIYGKGVLKPVWNSRDKRPDVQVIENPSNLRLGWGTSDYRELDWALYEYTISPFEAKRRYGVQIELDKQGRIKNVIAGGDHADPLNQAPALGGSKTVSRPVPYQPSQYEQHQVRVWDYWYKKLEGEDAGEPTVCNAIFVEGHLVKGPVAHREYPEIPYIVIEHDREPGSPEGIGDVEPLIDVQIELNRAMSHLAQLIADEIDPAWQLDADSIPPGMVPRGGEVLAAGEGKQIRPLEKPVNQFPIEQLIDRMMAALHFRTGLSEIHFAGAPGAQTAGRALQIQIEASANRISPRRDRLYRGLRELLIFWTFMAETVNPKITIGVDEQGQPETRGVKEVVGGYRRWKIVAPEITPRDNLEAITAVVNKLNAKLISLEDAMDELGVDSPLEMIQKIEKERMNPRLFPGDTQAYVAVLSMLQQYEAAAQAAGIAAGGAEGAAAAAEGQQMAEAQEAQPQGVTGQNGSDVPQPATNVGSAPPPGAPLSNQTLIRAQPSGQAQTLQQIKVAT